jgi:hypothetical protein
VCVGVRVFGRLLRFCEPRRVCCDQIVCDWLPRTTGKPCTVDAALPVSCPDLTVSEVLDASEGIQITTLSLNTLLSGAHIIKLSVNGVDGACVGVAYVSTKQVQGTTGVLHLDVLSSSLEPVGTLTLAYTIITPFVHQDNNISATYRSHWKTVCDVVTSGWIVWHGCVHRAEKGVTAVRASGCGPFLQAATWLPHGSYPREHPAVVRYSCSHGHRLHRV